MVALRSCHQTMEFCGPRFKWNQYILKNILKIGGSLDFRDTINRFPCRDICLYLIEFINGFLVNHQMKIFYLTFYVPIYTPQLTISHILDYI